MLFPVNRETRKLIAVIRDLLFLIAVNCAQDPPLTAPRRSVTLRSQKGNSGETLTQRELGLKCEFPFFQSSSRLF